MSDVMMSIEQFPQWIIDQLEFRDDGVLQYDQGG